MLNEEAKAVLIIVFNHKYDKNIQPLRELYKSRFKNIFFLVPFYEGKDQDVITIYENSYYFQGYLTQGFKTYFKEEYEHYLFVADDMILNPEIDENNYKEYFGLNENQNFISQILTLDNLSNNHTLQFETTLNWRGKKVDYWWRTLPAYDFSLKRGGAECINEVPTAEKAKEIIQKHGYEVKPLTYTNIYGGYGGVFSSTFRGKLENIARLAYNFKKRNNKFELKYPLVAGYSDIFIVNKNTIKKFIHYCGVFTATELFVEIAIPTSLLLAGDKVVTEVEIKKRGLLFWNYDKNEIKQYDEEMNKFNYELKKLIKNFPSDKLYIHPIKLSKWKTNLFS